MTERPKYLESRQKFLEQGSDRDRYIRKYHYTLRVLSDFSASLGIKRIRDIDEVLKELSPGILEATLSDLIIIASDDDTIQEAYEPITEGIQPYEKNIKGKKLPELVGFRDRFLKAHNFVIFKLDEGNDLGKLGFRNILISRCSAGSQKRIIGLYRSQTQYLNEDGLYVSSILNIIQESIKQGEIHQKKEEVSNNYDTALTGGSWRELISAAGNFIKANQDSDITKTESAWEDLIDSIRCTSNMGGNNTSGDRYFHEILGAEFPFPNDNEVFEFLKNKKTLKDSLEIKKEPLAYMAAIRSAMASRFGKSSESLIKFKWSKGISSISQRNGPRVTPDELKKLDMILDSVTSPVIELIQHDASTRNRLELSYLRTFWLCLFYFSLEALQTPADYLVNKCCETYSKVFSQTKDIISRYLSKKQFEETKIPGIEIDSDWLFLWLINNVIGSEKVSKFYKLLIPNRSVGSTEDKKPEDVGLNHQEGDKHNDYDDFHGGSTPASTAKFFVHLSHLVLYALHLMNQEEVYDRIANEKRDRNKTKNKNDISQDSNISEKVNHNQLERFAFGDIPVDLGISRSDSQLHILTKYAYHHWDVHREFKIYERLSEQLRYELPLYAANQFYRDHIYHVMDVCLLGELLLTSNVRKETNLFFWIKSTKQLTFAQVLTKLQQGIDPEALIRNWYVAALFHDFCYVIENVGNLITPVDNYRDKGFAKFVEPIKEGIDQAKGKLTQELDTHLNKFANKCSDANLKNTIDTIKNATDHGLAAWLHLMHWCDEVKQPLDNYSPALHAIMFHNQKGPQLDITKYPLTFLLLLCDHLQEWGRPLMGPGSLSQAIVESLRYFEKVELHKRVRVWRLKICGLKLANINKPKTILRTNKNNVPLCTLNDTGLKFILFYEDSMVADFEPIFTWLLFSDELQGLYCPESKKMIPIKIELKHEKPNSPEKVWHPTEMDLFQEFCHKEESAAYLLEWALNARGCKGKIKYKHEPNNKDTSKNNGFTETFSLDLPMNGRPLDRGINIKLFGLFKEWKERRLGRNIMGLGVGPWRAGKL